MARLLGPDESVRTVYLPSGLARAQGLQVPLYTDQSCTIPAGVLTEAGDPVVGSTVTVDAYSQIPVVQYPDGVDTLYTTVAGGPVVALPARGTDAPVRSVAGRTGSVTLTGVDVPEALAPAARTPRYVQAPVILTTFQAGHGYTNNAGSTYNGNDTSDFILGTQSARITTGGTGAAANVSRLAQTASDATARAVRLRVKVDDSTHLAELTFFLGTAGLAANAKWSYAIAGGSKAYADGEWFTITLSWANATLTGTPTRGALTDVRLGVIDDNTGNPVTVHYQSVELVPDASPTWPNGLVSICFDDVYATQWSLARPKLDQYGFPATWYTIRDYIDLPQRLTLAQLRALRDRGHEIAAHADTGVSHSASWTGMTAAQLLADFRTQRSWLISAGLRGADGTAAPLGQFGKTTDGTPTIDLVRQHFAHARTTAGRTVETWPPADVMRLRAASGVSTAAGGITPASLTTATTGLLDRIKTDPAWLILVFHDITTVAPTATTQCLQADFNAIVDKIAANGTPVVPVGDVLRYYG